MFTSGRAALIEPSSSLVAISSSLGACLRASINDADNLVLLRIIFLTTVFFSIEKSSSFNLQSVKLKV